MAKSDGSAIILLIIATFLWAFSFILIKVGLREIPPVTLAALRFSLASIVFVVAMFWKYGSQEISIYLKENWMALLAIGFTGVFLPNVFQNWGMLYTTAYVSSILQATGPIFTAILAAIFLKESLGTKKGSGAMLALIGAIMISSDGDLRLLWNLTDYSFGNLLLLGSAISYGIYTVLSKARLEEGEPLMVVALSTALGSVILVLFLPVVDPLGLIPTFSQSMWMIVIALAIFPTAIAFFLWFEALKKIEASKASFFIFLIPIFTTGLAWLILNESISLFVISNAILIILGIGLAGAE
ncbi:MAG: DMT family transporter [Candidatus Hydrothermarchaeales archaeon]